MAEPFKNNLGPAAIARLAEHVRAAWVEFPAEAFVADATAGLDALELMDRVRQIAGALDRHLPAFPQGVQILVDALGPEAPTAGFEAEHEGGLRGWPVMAVSRYVGQFGLEHFEASMVALDAITRRWSGEFDIRPFLERSPEATWAQVMAWTADPSVHVRRLASEGTRPRLPWGQRVAGLIEDPRRGLAVLERLKDDPERFVQRSVANHLNDISKDHPALVLEVARRWLDSASPDRAWLVRHALRSRLKAADPAALALFGYPDPPAATVEGFVAGRAVDFTGRLPFAFTLVGHADEKVLLDYVVHYVKARGPRKTKVFRIADRALTADQRVGYDKAVDFKPVSTRTHHPGAHRLELRVNGRIVCGAEFELRPA